MFAGPGVTWGQDALAGILYISFVAEFFLPACLRRFGERAATCFALL